MYNETLREEAVEMIHLRDRDLREGLCLQTLRRAIVECGENPAVQIYYEGLPETQRYCSNPKGSAHIDLGVGVSLVSRGASVVD
jgi:hypothetical protein